MSALSVENARRAYGAKVAVDGASLRLEPGRIACLLGPSGCGKSTLLRLIAGLERLDGGVVRDGERVLSGPGVHLPPELRDVGFVFQDYALFPHLTVEANVAFGLKDLPGRERRARALAQLERVRLADRAGAYPQTLSGGEQQRVALARALAREPRAVLLDEPFSGLDGRLKAEVRDATLSALRGTGAAALIVTHDAEEALHMADDLALMQAGRILQTGSPRDCYLRPVSMDAARLLGEANAVHVEVSAGAARTAFGTVPAPGVPDGRAVLMARPEAFRLDPAGRPATVRSARFGGARTEVVLTAGDAQAHAHVPSRDAPQAGQTVSVTLDESLCTVFPA
ncbi:MAG TPA: ABC transporter ATP-binding protein [Caulobacteraceae bacterium]|nr:ABC transporter ATP-binding protein [Caulobacteraceae bacterium]